MSFATRSLVTACLIVGLAPCRPAAAQQDAQPVGPEMVQEGLMLKLNLPSLTLELYRGTELVRRYPVAIGDTAYPTPQGIFEITRVDWDPWWIPPASDWAKDQKVTPPGPLNPMGRVRLSFRELYFIHGTPDHRSVGSTASHGCVRLYNADAIDLAKRILRYGAPGVSSREVDQLAARRGKTRTIRLQRTVPVEIRYDIATMTGHVVTVYPDVYGRVVPGAAVDSVLAALQRIGVDLATIDTVSLEHALDDSCERPLVIDGDSSAPTKRP